MSPQLVLVPANPSEAVGHYALHGVGTLHVDYGWVAATAKAGDESCRFVATGRRGGREATAADAAGRLVGDYRQHGRALRWGSRQLHLRPPHWRSSNDGFVLADGEQILALIYAKRGRPRLNPINIDVNDAVAVEAGLLLFVAFLVGWLTHDTDGD